jgi:hypothetical protein
VAASGFSSRHGVEITLFFQGFLNLALSLAVCVKNLGHAPSRFLSFWFALTTLVVVHLYQTLYKT